ncbi:hypothetical protein GTY38_16610 [Streptomyces sp. SID8369]|nr:hypothetical protein [Streptomyces sp. SID8369]
MLNGRRSRRGGPAPPCGGPRPGGVGPRPCGPGRPAPCRRIPWPVRGP